MTIEKAVANLLDCALRTGLIAREDRSWAANRLLQALGLDGWTPPEADATFAPEAALEWITDWAVQKGLCADDITSRDLFDTELMGRLTPRPSEVVRAFESRFAHSPQTATDWFYRFSQDTNYIRRRRIARDMKWVTATEYGDLDITINLSKPEKDPRAIAAARSAPQTGYPKCQLCLENEGYAGRLNHPARQNHRVVPVRLGGERWYFQYSPYVYYNEHCIVFCREHRPMKIDRGTFVRLLDFVRKFPHYFIGSNADLPIVGGSILSHDHFQGGRYEFPMARAPIEQPAAFPGFPDVAGGIVKWPMSVLRLRAPEADRLVELAGRILTFWRGYTDETVRIFAQTDGVPHNTITPIARMRDGQFELDLVLRNNLTTEEYPLGLYHPHPELHHIKKENIGLIEVMGLAVLPARLRDELAALEEYLLSGAPVPADGPLAKHAGWVSDLRRCCTPTPDNVTQILHTAVGECFAQVLEHAGVFKRTPEGRQAFQRFIDHCKGEP